jgi:monofunctional biosynthetic peptidoglycan transglycosylase
MKLYRRWWFWLILMPVLTILAVQAFYAVQIWWWIDHNPETTSFMRQQREILTEKNPKFRLKQKWVPYSRISKNLKRAIIASEDANFSEHEGIDWVALEKAYTKNQKRGRVVAGGSTITQQLAKNLFLSGQRSYIRKAQEVAITYMLETMMSKERIFEIYLNVVEWGVGVFGAEAAAQHYYGVSAAGLSASQAAKLAVMLPNPRYYDMRRGSPYLMKRTAVILRRMGSAELP